MFKKIVPAFLILLCTTSAFAQNKNPIAADAEKKETTAAKETDSPDQFSSFVMKGWNAGLEYSSMGIDMHIDKKTAGISSNITINSNENASALGVSLNYAHLPRDRFGYMVGLGLIQKVENNTGDANSTKSVDGFMQIRPEGNIGYALANGLYGMLGAHLSGLVGGGSDIDNSMKRVGIGAQFSIGYVPTRNLGFDIGYYLTMHALSDDLVKSAELSGDTVDRDKSYYRIHQLRLRATYFF